MNQSQEIRLPESLEVHRIKALSFDLDDTLWPVGIVIAHAETVLSEWLAKSWPRLMQSLTPEQQLSIRNEVRAANPALAHDLTETRRLGIKACLEEVGYEGELASREAMAIFLTARNHVSPFDDVVAALAQLASAYPLVALSNGNADVMQTPLRASFKSGISAESVGAAKPDPRMFARAAEMAGCDLNELLHIGDHPLEDAQGAMAVGCQAILVNRFNKQHDLAFSVPIVTDLTPICQWLQV